MSGLIRMILVGIAIACAFQFFRDRSANHFVGSAASNAPLTSHEFKDGDGNDHDFAQITRPKLVAFWITQCGYSKRAMWLMNEARQNTTDTDLEVVGFYLNQADDRQIKSLARQAGIAVPVAAAQQTPELMESLIQKFRFTKPGRDLYLVDRQGVIQRLDVSDREESNESLQRRVASFVQMHTGPTSL